MIKNELCSGPSTTQNLRERIISRTISKTNRGEIMIAVNAVDEYAQKITETLIQNHLITEEELSNVNQCLRGW